MRVEIPRSVYPLTRIVVVTPAGVFSSEFDQSHKVYDFELPDGVDEAKIGVVAEFLTDNRCVQSTAILRDPTPPAPPAPTVIVTSKPLQTRRPPSHPKQDAAPAVQKQEQLEAQKQQEAAGENAEPNSVTPEPPNANP